MGSAVGTCSGTLISSQNSTEIKYNTNQCGQENYSPAVHQVERSRRLAHCGADHLAQLDSVRDAAQRRSFTHALPEGAQIGVVGFAGAAACGHAMARRRFDFVLRVQRGEDLCRRRFDKGHWQNPSQQHIPVRLECLRDGSVGERSVVGHELAAQLCGDVLPVDAHCVSGLDPGPHTHRGAARWCVYAWVRIVSYHTAGRQVYRVYARYYCQND